ncbi:MAG TPA: diguanylate cyclase [bacterium]|nr:diguanylate cyclase [bacterium]
MSARPPGAEHDLAGVTAPPQVQPTGPHGPRVPLLVRVILIFVLGAAVACAASALVYRAVDSAAAAISGVRAANQVIVANDRLSGAVVDAETTERAFLLTGNNAFLTAYAGALRSFDDAVSDLRKLVTSPEQMGRLEEMQSLFGRWRTGVASSEIAARQAAPIGLSQAAQTAYATTLTLRRLAAEYAGAPTAARFEQWTVQVEVLRQDLNAMVALDQSSSGLAALQRAYTLVGDAEMLGRDTRSGPMTGIAAELDGILSDRLKATQAGEARVQQLVTLDAGRTLIDQIRHTDVSFVSAANAGLEARIAANQRSVLQAKLASAGAPLLIVLLLGLVLRVWSSVGASIAEVAEASAALAAGDFTRRVQVRGQDRTAVMARAYNAMADRMRAQANEAQALVRMGDLFQAAVSVEEACEIIARGMPDMFPGLTGAVYFLSPSRDVLESIATWGGVSQGMPVFGPDDCWGLRRGHAHYFSSSSNDIPCRHLPPPPGASVCVPLVAQGDTIGLLSLVETDRAFQLSEQAVRLARVVGDQIGLAIANLRLRETLRDQSIRDALTGLYNRRYLEETLDREIRRAERTGQPLGIVMFDIDLFKQFNDAFGHGAGDHLLRDIGALLRTLSRREDIACRYGGDEFVIALLGTTLEDARQRAEEIGNAARHLDIRYQDGAVGSVTLSLGVAAFPVHGATTETLIRAADAALYRAKQHGRARVEVAAA